jgi:hypothetical protein
MANVPAPPATCANVAGPIQIWVGTGAAFAMEFLGYTINGAEISEQPFMAPLASDDYGGDQGPPADYQLMGTQTRIGLELLKYSPTVAAKLESFYNLVALASVSGTAAVGMLMACTPLTTRVLLLAGTAAAPTYVRNYPLALILEPIEYSPIGSQASRLRVNFIVNAKAGVIPWDTTVTSP